MKVVVLVILVGYAVALGIEALVIWWRGHHPKGGHRDL
jgi:hypothetical protein